MSRVFDKVIRVQALDELTEDWTDRFKLHAYVNAPSSKDKQYTDAGATRTKRYLIFEVRYFTAREESALNFQGFRIGYCGVIFTITDF